MREPTEHLRVQMELANPNLILMRLRVPGEDSFTMEDENGMSEVNASEILYENEEYACVQEHVIVSIEALALGTDFTRSLISSF